MVDVIRLHWLADVAQRAGIGPPDGVVIANTATVAEVWPAIASACGIDEATLGAKVAVHFRLGMANLATAESRTQRLLPERLVRKHLVFPLRETDRHVVVATGNPTDMAAEQDIGFAAGRQVTFEVGTPRAIAAAIETSYAPERVVDGLLQRVTAGSMIDVQVIEDVGPGAVAAQEVEAAPVIKLTNIILRDAMLSGASDIHLAPGREGGTVRLRIDGVLRPHLDLPTVAMNRVISRIKVMGKLDIADRLRPQDGRARVQISGRMMDLRISTVPTRDSEKAVIRLLDPQAAKRLDDLRIPAPELARFRRLLGYRDGIVVVTGPTGSGKTTTLYAALQEIATSDVNITTVEDPVEYELAGITQIQVETKRGVTFASALRSILRQDPDVILLGEIRDLETAEVAVQAALTGHLVLSTLHTNDAAGAVIRLADLGLDRSKIASALRGAIAQRLVRRTCVECAAPIVGALSPDEQMLATRYGVTPTVRAAGCATCGGTGYRGRLPVQEVMILGGAMERLITEGAASADLQKAAVAGGMRSMRDVALESVRAGHTTLREVDRVLGETGTEDPPVAATGAAHVLLVDDDAVNRTIARVLLEKGGFRVSEADDGIAALECLAATSDVRLMVLDLDMPRLGGLEVLQRLRGTVVTATLPVIVLTGSTTEASELEAMELGADDYVRKPVDPARFLARVKAVLRRAGG